MSTPRLVLRAAHRGCSPPGRFWGVAVYPPAAHTLNLSEYHQVGNYDMAQLTVLEIDRKKKWILISRNSELFSVCLMTLYSRREKLPIEKKYIFFKSICLLRCEICSWEQGGDCRWGSMFSITQQWALRQVITCSRSFLAYKIVNVRQDLWGPFSLQIHGFLLDVNGESAGRSPFLRRFLAECFLWLPL